MIANSDARVERVWGFRKVLTKLDDGKIHFENGNGGRERERGERRERERGRVYVHQVIAGGECHP